MFVVERQEPLAARLFDFILNLPLHAGRCCALARRETEDMRLGKLQFTGKLIGLFEITFAFTRETSDDIGAYGNPWYQAPGGGDDCLIACTVITTGHAPQDGVRSALHREMKVAAHARIFPQIQPLQAKILRLERRDAYTRNSGLAQKCGNEIPKILFFVVPGMVIPQVNTCQYYLLVAGSYLALHMLNDGSNIAAARTAAYVGNDAIGAAVIATILNFHLHTRARCWPGANCGGQVCLLRRKW